MKLNVEIARTDYEEAVVNFSQTLYSALSDVENALSARTNYAEEIKQTEESLTLQEKPRNLLKFVIVLEQRHFSHGWMPRRVGGMPKGRLR